jgi:hypothetical protein
LLTDIEKELLIKYESGAEKWIRKFVGAEEFINNLPRWCLWLKNISPNELILLPKILARVQLVQENRATSKKEATRKWASKPTQFTEDRQPSSYYLALPEVSSERRYYLPVGYLPPEIISSNKLYIIKDAHLYHFGVLNSTFHMAWMRAITGRLKSDYQYSASIVYNNFPWPENPSDKQKAAIEASAQAVLDARSQFPDATLADLYDPLTMPPVLLKAHQTLDKAVDAAYGKTNFKSEAERVAFLFERYQVLTSQ